MEQSKLSDREREELYWRTRPEREVEAEMVRRFEMYFSRKLGHEVRWCARCREFCVPHEHQG